jgi:tRNA 2-selenouridine synthase
MRSENMAWILDQAGFRVTLLEGGYKSYRRFIRSELVKDLDLIVLGGMTGSGKTEILQSLLSLGEQVIDLEKAACHKGSVFGGLGEDPQPTNEQFENELYALKEKLDLSRRVWVEDESRMLGNITLPDPFFSLMEHSVLIKMEVPVHDRILRLVSMYAHFSKEELANAVTKISEKLGGTRTRTAMEAIQDSNFETVAELALSYYDKAYRNAISRRPNQEIVEIMLDHNDATGNARVILRHVDSVRIKK